MTLLYVILGIIVTAVILILVIPVKIKINFCLQTKSKNTEEDLKTANKIDIYILRIIKVKTIEIKQNDKTNEKTNNKNNAKNESSKNVIADISKSLENYIKYEKKDSSLIGKEDLIKLKKGLKFEEFYLNLGFNLKEPILNAYILVLMNTILNLYIAKNANHFNLEKTKYQTHISNKIIDFKFYSIINFKLVNNIIIILKLIIKFSKGGNKNGKTTSN